jgi:hypothetical protein
MIHLKYLLSVFQESHSNRVVKLMNFGVTQELELESLLCHLLAK